MAIAKLVGSNTQGTTGMKNLTDLASRSLDEDSEELGFKANVV